MKPFRPSTPQGHRSSRRARKAQSGRTERSQLIRRQSWLETLENRCLLTIFNPQIVQPQPSALPVEGTAFGTGTPLIATFASPNPLANLSATVAFPSGTTTATVTATAFTETVIMGLLGTPTQVPEFAVNYTGTWTPPEQSPGVPFTVSIADSTAGSNGTVAVPGSIAVRDAALTLTTTPVSSLTATEGVPFTPAGGVATFSDAPGSTTADFTGTIDWGDNTAPTAAVFSGATGGPFTVTGTHTFLDPQTSAIKLTINDGGTSYSFNIGNAGFTDPAITGATSAVSAVAGAALNNVQVATITDPNTVEIASGLTASIAWGDGATTGGTIVQTGTTATTSTFSVLGSHTYATRPAGGTATITVTVLDDGGTAPSGSTATVTSTATIVNSPLALSAVPVVATEPATIPAGTQLGTFIDQNGIEPGPFTGTVSFNGAAAVAATIAQVDTSNLYNVTLTANQATALDEGVYPFTLTVTNTATTATATTTGSLTVNDALLALATTPAVAATENVPVTPTTNPAIITFTDANTAATTADFTGTIDWGDNTAPTTATFTGATGGPFSVTGTHTYLDPPTSPIKVTVNDAGTGYTFTGATATYTDPAITGATSAVSAVVGAPLTNVQVATVTDPNTAEIASGLSASIAWGDGTTSGGTIVQTGTTATTSTFAVLGSHTYATRPVGGTATITVTILDDGGTAPSGSTATVTSTATIVNSALALSATPVVITEGASIPAGTVLGTFIDNNGTGATYTAGSSVTIAGVTVPGTGLTFTQQDATNQFVVTNTAAISPAGGIDEGISNFTLTVTSNGGATATTTGSLTVNDAALTATGGAGAVQTEGIPFTQTPLMTFSDANTSASGSLADFNATIDWGDGSPSSVGTVTGSAGVYAVGAGHTYAEAGTYVTTTTVTDDGGSRVSRVQTITVNDAILTNPTAVNIVGNEDQALNNVPVMIFTDPNPLATPSDIIATIDWGDPSPDVTPGIVTRIGSTATGAALFQVSGTHIFSTGVGSPYTLRVTVTDEDLSTNTLTVAPTATISPGVIGVTTLPISATSGVPTATGTLGTPVSNGLLATFIDASGADPVSNYSASFSWGDGTTDTTPNFPGGGSGALTILAMGGGQFGVYGTHTYAAPGLFRLTATVDDTDGGTAVAATGVGGNLAFVLAPSTLTTSISPTPVPGPVPGVLTPGTEGIALPSNATVGTGVELAVFTVNAPNQLAANYTATIDWGDGSPQSAGFIFVDTVHSTPTTTAFVVTGFHTYAEARTTSYPITVYVTQETPGTIFVDSDTTVHTNDTVVINDALLTPGSVVPIFATENQPLNSVPVATFTDANPGATAADFSTTINWGDGTPVDSTTTRVALIGGTSAGAVFGVFGSHVYTGLGSNGGKFLTEVTVLDEDPNGSSVSVPPLAPPPTITNVTISQSPISVSVIPQTATVNTATAKATVVATFTDAAGAGSDPIGNYTATIDWGDGSPTSSGAIADLGGGTFSVTTPAAGHTYTTAGTFVIKVTVNDSDPTMGIGANLVIVSGGVITASPAPAITGAVEGKPITATVATFTDTDTSATASSFSAVINWGDGSPASAGTITGSAGSFTVTGTHAFAEESPTGYTVSVVITGNGSTTQTTTPVGAVADAPLSPGTSFPIFVNEGQSTGNVPVATFVDANPRGTSSDFTATISWGDSTMSPGIVLPIGGSAAGEIFGVFGSHVYATPGTFSTSVLVNDVGGSSTTIAGTNNVTVANSPLIVTARSQTTGVGTPIPAGTVVATFLDDAGTDPITNFSGSINWGDGTVPDTFTSSSVTALGGGQYQIVSPAAHTYAHGGTFALTVTVNDTDGATGSGAALVFVAPATIIVIAPPSGPNNPALATEGVSQTFTLGTFTSSNPSAVVGDFSATVDWGDGSPRSSGIITGPATGGVFTITGTHTYRDETTTPDTIIVTLTDNTGGTSSVSFPAIVADATLTPGVSLPIFATENEPLNNVPVATFTDANLVGTAADFTATINWGDNTGVDPNARVVQTGGTATDIIYTVFGSHQYTTTGNFATSVTVQDSGGGAAIAVPTVAPPVGSGTVNVSNAAIVVTAQPLTPSVGVAVPVGTVLATFVDNASTDLIGNYSATVNWGDDGASTFPTTIVALGGGQFQVQSADAHTYITSGVFATTITVTDTDGATGTGSGLVFVAPATITLTPPAVTPPATTVTATEGISQTFTVGTFTSSNPGAAAGDFSVTIDWGDGTPRSSGLVSGAVGGPFTITAPHTYADEGSVTAIVTVTDSTGGSTSTTFPVVVADAPLTPGTALTITTIENQPLNNIPVATFNDANLIADSGDFTGTINWGDGTALDTNLRVSLTGGTASNYIFTVFGSHNYTKVGTFSTSVTINDFGGSSTTTTGSANVVTVAPSPIVVTGLPLGSFTFNAMTPANLPVATFIDTASTDPLTNYSATINWGDGTAPVAATSIIALGGGQFEVLAPTHVYTKTGEFPVTVTVTDTPDGVSGIGGNEAIVAAASVVVTPVTGPILNPATGAPFFEGQPLVNVALAMITTTDTTATASQFTAAIDWGDGTPQSAGLIVGPTGGPFTVEGSHTYAETNLAGYHVLITVNGPSAMPSTVATTIPIQDAPLSNGVAIPISATEGQPLINVPVATFVDANTLGSVADFSATIDWGDNTTPTTGQVVLLGANPGGSGLQYEVLGSHTYTSVGTHTTTVIVKDEDGNSITITGTAAVTVTAAALVITAAPITAIEGIPVPSGQPSGTPPILPPQNGPNPPTIVATFIDLAGPDPVTNYVATIDWGNGTAANTDSVTPGVVFQQGSNFVILAPPSSVATVIYPDEGNYLVRVTLVDTDGGGTVFAVSPMIVADAALTASPPASQPVIPPQTQQIPSGQIPIASFTDANPMGAVADFTTTIDWGDGTPQSAGQVTQPGGVGTAFIVSGNHTYLNPSAAGYTVTVFIRDDGGSSLTITRTIVVNPSVITVTPQTFNAVEGQPVSNVVVATFHDSGLAGPLSSYTATIDWNESSTPTTNLGQIVQLGDNDFQVLGSLPTGFPEEGTFSVFVTLSHNGTLVPGGSGPGGSFIATAKVADAPLSGTAVPIVANEGTPFTGPVANFTDADPNGTATDYTITIGWGDGTLPVTFAGNSSNILQPGGPGSPFTVNVTAPGHTYLEEGTYTLTVTVVDHTASFTATEQVTVNDTPPVAANPQPAVTATEGVPITEYVARFQEIYVDPRDTSRVNAEPSSDFTATINWGDGTPSTEGAIISAGSPGVYYVLGSHLYPSAGTNGGAGQFTINTTIVEDGGGVLQVTNIANVNDVPITLTGFINQATVVNEGPAGVIVSGNQPSFYGTLSASPEVDAAGGHVFVYAYPVGGGAPILMGQTQAGSDGSWSITSIALPDGTYNVVAFASDAQGQTTTQATILPSGFEGPLVIDTHGPKVLDASFANRVGGEVNVTFSDVGGLLDLRTVQDAASYMLTKAGTNKHFLVNVISQSVNSATATDTVTLLINDGRQLRGGNYTFTVLAGHHGTGIRDLAGNPLDGVFYGFFPSGNNRSGGSNFVALLNAVHHVIFAPGTVVGHASPVVPPGTPATGTTIPTANPQTPAGNPNFFGSPAGLKSAKVHNRVIHLSAKKAPAVTTTAHDVALEQLGGKQGVFGG
jgi:hypothetical protein